MSISFFLDVVRTGEQSLVLYTDFLVDGAVSGAIIYCDCNEPALPRERDDRSR